MASTATVIRVKRRIDEEPLNAFVLNSKKRRFENLTVDSPQSQQQQQQQHNQQNVNALSGNKDGTSATPSTAAAATSSTVMRFAGTVSTQDDDIATHIRRLTKAEARDAVNHVRRTSPTSSSLAAGSVRRSTLRQAAREDRFKIVNCFRTQTAAGDAEDDDDAAAAAAAADNANNVSVQSAGQTNDGKLTVVDIEKNGDAATPNGGTAVVVAGASMPLIDEPTGSAHEADGAPQYVYDLYFPAETTDANRSMDIFIEDLLSVEPFDQQLTYGSARDNGLRADTSDDSEDSNDEGNARNDYPDTEEDDDDDADGTGGGGADDDDSVDEGDMRRAFNSMDIDGELSSDDEAAANGAVGGGRRHNRFVYTIDDDEADLAGGGGAGDSDVDEEVAGRYGVAYARYKARLLRRQRIGSDEDEEEEDEDETGGDSDDSDRGRRRRRGRLDGTDSEAEMSEAEADNYYSD